MIHLDKENFDEEIKKGTVLVDFFATWCGPCKMLAPVLEKIDDKIKIIKVDIDQHSNLTNKYKIMSVPTLIYFKDGKEVKIVSGFQSEDSFLKDIEEIKKL